MDRRAGTPEDSQVIVRTLACVLEKLVDVNHKLDNPPGPSITKFHASRPPSITISDYLERINKYAACSTECLVLALIYIDRLIQQSNFALSSLNVHRVIITSVMLAAKFFDDKYFNNLYYAKVGGVPCKEINSLEVEFLFLINFSLHVTEDMFMRYHNELINHAVNSTCACCIGVAHISRPVSPAMPHAADVVPHHHQQATVFPTMVCPPTPPTTQPTTQASITMSHALPADVERFTYYSTPAYESAATEQLHGGMTVGGHALVPPHLAAPMGNVMPCPPPCLWDRAPGGALLVQQQQQHYVPPPKSCMVVQTKILPHVPVAPMMRSMPFAPVQDSNTRGSASMAFFGHHQYHHQYHNVLHT